MTPRTYQAEHWLSFLRLSDEALLKHTRMDVFKATGKGGQKKNKTSNAIRLTLKHLSVTESGSRSRAENTSKALWKLRLAIALDHREEKRTESQPEKVPAEIEPYLNRSEIRINAKNPLYPVFIGWFFQRFLLRRGNWRAIAADLGITPSQARKFVEKHTDLKRALAEASSRLDQDA